MQKKFDDFNSDLKANEVRLAEMNEIAMQLMSLGQTEAALKIQTQMEDLNRKWVSIQQLTAERAQQLGSAHEVQRFHRDVDETKDWIHEKDEALNNDDLGKDLRSVQALQRKHEGLERDLAALGDKVCFLFHSLITSFFFLRLVINHQLYNQSIRMILTRLISLILIDQQLI